MTIQPIAHRPYEPDDYDKVRELLITTFPITPPRFNWGIRRWDGNFHHLATPYASKELAKTIHVWETVDGKIVGVTHPEGDANGDAYFQVHPDYRPDIEEEMLLWAIENLARPNDKNQSQLEIFVNNYDTPRLRLLEQYGFEQTPYGGVTRHMRLGQRPLPTPNLHPDYTLRTTRPQQSDYDAIATLLNASFNRDFHTGAEVGNFMTQSPSFDHEIDLVAVAPDGTFAAYVGLTYDAANHSAEFEPVCTHPDHQRKGLARALMQDGLHRIKALGAKDVFVDTGDQFAANKLYEAVGFPETYKGYIWRKTDSLP